MARSGHAAVISVLAKDAPGPPIVPFEVTQWPAVRTQKREERAAAAAAGGNEAKTLLK